jgi:hypothetical protein
MTDSAPEEGTLTAAQKLSTRKPDTDFNGQTWQEGDNKFQRAISAWRSGLPIAPIEEAFTDRILISH